VEAVVVVQVLNLVSLVLLVLAGRVMLVVPVSAGEIIQVVAEAVLVQQDLMVIVL
jgi:hypothetical protein